MNKNVEYIAYDGEYFAIEWYFNDNYDSQALNYYQSLSDDERIKVLKLFKRMGDSGEIKDKTKFMNEGNKIYASNHNPTVSYVSFTKDEKLL